MKHRLLFTLLLGGMAVVASAQTITGDVTSKLTNADFMADSPLTTTVYTYDYNMTDDGAGAGGNDLYGMQPVTGWTANAPSTNTKVEDRTDGTNARAAGVFAYENDADDNGQTVGLGGTYYAPYQQGGQCLGMVSVWSSTPVYTQEVTLEAGAYMLVFKACNTAGTATVSNLCGFVVDDETQYLSTKETYQVRDSEFELDSVVFRLTETTTGNVQIGFKCGQGSGSAPHVFFDCVKLYKVDEAELIQKEIDEAKEELLALINLGKSYGVSTSEAQAVYNNANATMEEVQAAIAKQKELNEAGVTDLSEYFITNPKFDVDEGVEGGICTYDYDCEKNNIPLTNYSMLPCTGWERNNTTNGRAAGVFNIGSGAFLGGAQFIVPNEMSDGSTEGKVLGMVTCWSQTVQYKQAVTLPAGSYTISMSYYNAGGTTAITKNLIGFVADNGIEYLGTNTTFPVGKWTTEEVKFELSEETSGYFTMGYASPNVGSANVPHFFTDGFKLYYVGSDVDPSMMALVSAVSSAKKLSEETFMQSLKDQLEKAISDGEDLIANESKDSEANKAAAQAINALLDDVKASIEAFANLKTFFDGDFAAAYEKYEGSELQTKLDELSDAISEQIDDEPTWTVDEINACIASLPTIIKDYVQEQFDKAVETGESDGDLDISILYGDLLGVTYSTTAYSNTAVVDKQWVYGDATNFKTQYGTMEVWNQSPFTVSQTMSNMPAGTYTISTRAFYRSADQASNYDAYTANPGTNYAYVFAGNLKTPLSNVALIASSESDEFANGNTTVADGALYVPNSQNAAHDVFENIYKDYDEVTYKSVKTVLTAEGDLTFGVKGDQMEANNWVVWYTFELAYNPEIDETLVDEELAAVIAELDDYLAENSVSMTSSVSEEISDVSDKAKEAQDGTVEQKSAAVTEVKEALEAAKANVAAVEALEEAYLMLQESFETFTEATEEAQANAEAALDKYDNKDNMSTAEVEELTKEMIRAAALLKIPDYSNPPTDFTQVIVNPSFETGDGTGWSYYAGSDTGVKDVTNSTYIVENADGAYLFNTWNSSAPADGFWISQTLYSLPSGTYTLTVLCASSDNNEITVSAAGSSTSAAMENPQTMGQDVSLSFSLATESDVEIKVSSPKWFKCDNFRLTYEGASIRGDVNGDGVVDIKDVVAIINHIAGTDTYANANVNGDTDEEGNEIVDINDVVAVINIMAGN